MRTWLALIILVLSDCAGSLLMARGMRRVGEVKRMSPQALWELLQRALMNSDLAWGVINMAISFFMLIALLSWADISFVIPATALTEPVNMLGTRYILKEKVAPLRWLSIVFICLGIALISIN
jgi:hypothetical protein